LNLIKRYRDEVVNVLDNFYKSTIWNLIFKKKTVLQTAFL
jgi:hypothetical protein